MIKQTLFALLFITAGSTTAQTDIIAARSHSSSEFSTENDNYGLPSRSIDSIIYIGNGCIIEDANWHGRDTFCDHPVFVENDYDLKKLKELYPSYVVFVGFSKSEKKRLDKQNSMPWFIALIGLSYLIYLIFPKLQSRKN